MKSVVVVGLGQLGSLFSSAFLKEGYGVVPVVRGQSFVERSSSNSELALLAVGEDDIGGLIRDTPDAMLDRLVLIQNELRPATWADRYAPGTRPTEPGVCIVWFEKKGDKPPVSVMPSVLYGPRSEFMLRALVRLGLPARQIATRPQLYHELCVKNLYILGLNFSGLLGASQAGELLDNNLGFDALIDELITFEQRGLEVARIDYRLDPQALKVDLRLAIEADPKHGCAGRTAPARLTRTLSLAEKWGIEMPRSQAIFHKVAL